MSTPPRKMRPPELAAADKELIAARIRERREKSGGSTLALSRAAGLSPTVVSQIERGLKTPALGTLAALARALGCTVPDLTAGVPLPPAAPPKD